jgi:hypothetical protein
MPSPPVPALNAQTSDIQTAPAPVQNARIAFAEVEVEAPLIYIASLGVGTLVGSKTLKLVADETTMHEVRKQPRAKAMCVGYARFERGDKNDLRVNELEHLMQIIIAMPDAAMREKIKTSLIAGGIPDSKILETNG